MTDQSNQSEASERPPVFNYPNHPEPQVKGLSHLSAQLDYAITLLERLVSGIDGVKKDTQRLIVNPSQRPGNRPENPKGRPSPPRDGRSGVDGQNVEGQMSTDDFPAAGVITAGKGIAPEGKGQGS